MKSKILYKINFPLIKSIFVRKINRFVLEVKIRGKRNKVYMPNPGRLTTILTFNRELLLKEKNSGKYKYEVFAAKMSGFYATLDPKLANLLFKEALNKKLISKFKNCKILKKEINTKAGRIDFLIKCDNHKKFLEVKSCTHVENGIAKFPDRKTERGKRHLKFLMKNKGYLVIVVQRPDAKYFMPFKEIDEEFSKIFKEGVKSKKLKVIVFTTKFNYPYIYFYKEIPVE